MREKEYLMKDQQSSISAESSHSTEEENLLTKVFTINDNERIVFARFNSYIMLPWFTISEILNVSDEEKIRSIVTYFFLEKIDRHFVLFIQANKLGFKPIRIDSLSHPLLYSQITQFITPITVRSNQLSLYSIDCVRKILQIYQYQQSDVFHLLDRARLAEASNDTAFWEKSFQ